MKIARIIFVVLITLISLLFAKVNIFAQAGGAAVPFLVITPDARAAGMGEVGTAIADDVNAVYWNPAGLAFLDSVDTPTGSVPYRQIAISFAKWLPQFNTDLYYGYATVGNHFDAIDGTVALSFVYMNLGEFTRTFDNGKAGQKFQSNEFALGLSYGTIVSTDLALGIQLKYIRSSLAPATAFTGGDAGIGNSVSFDLGILWKPMKLDIWGLELGEVLQLGANLQNIGPKVTYRTMSDPLPTTLRLGAALNLFHDEFNDFKVALDVSKLLIKRDSAESDPLPTSLVTGWQNPGAEFAFGAEYWYQNIIALRAGYFTEPSALGNRRYWNFGAGVRYDMFELDFSFLNTIEENHPLANTMRFSLLIDLK